MPGNLVDGPDGDIWSLSNGVQALIGKISNSGVVTTYQTPPNLNVNSITASPTNKSLWFTAAAYPDDHFTPIQIGQITTDGTITIDPADSSLNIGYGQITFGPGGNLWYLENCTEITPESTGFHQAIGEADLLLPVTGATSVNPVHQGARRSSRRSTGPPIRRLRRSRSRARTWINPVIGGADRPDVQRVPRSDDCRRPRQLQLGACPPRPGTGSSTCGRSRSTGPSTTQPTGR